MYPSCEMVEYASTRLMSHCLSAMVAANSAVSAPIPATVTLATGDSANSTPQRAAGRRRGHSPAQGGGPARGGDRHEGKHVGSGRSYTAASREKSKLQLL